MARTIRLPGEKPIFWIRSAKRDLMQFPERARSGIGFALSVAQFGSKHPNVKPWKGEGPGVMEIVEDFRGNAYRAVYTVRFQRAIYVLHAFQKKSPTAIRTARSDVDMVRSRLILAREDYEARYGKEA